MRHLIQLKTLPKQVAHGVWRLWSHSFFTGRYMYHRIIMKLAYSLHITDGYRLMWWSFGLDEGHCACVHSLRNFPCNSLAANHFGGCWGVLLRVVHLYTHSSIAVAPRAHCIGDCIFSCLLVERLGWIMFLTFIGGFFVMIHGYFGWALPLYTHS